MVSPAGRREASVWLTEQFEVSQRRACRVLDLNLATCRYKARKPSSCALTERLRVLAWERPRFGYRRLGYLLRREGFHANHKRMERIYRAEGLAVRRRRRKRISLERRRQELPLHRPNQCWSVDFMSDQLGDGRRIRTLNVINNFTRECLAIEVAPSLPGCVVARVLDQVAALRGYPQRLRSDNGPEFTGRVMDQWAYRNRPQCTIMVQRPVCR